MVSLLFYHLVHHGITKIYLDSKNTFSSGWWGSCYKQNYPELKNNFWAEWLKPDWCWIYKCRNVTSSLSCFYCLVEWEWQCYLSVLFLLSIFSCRNLVEWVASKFSSHFQTLIQMKCINKANILAFQKPVDFIILPYLCFIAATKLSSHFQNFEPWRCIKKEIILAFQKLMLLLMNFSSCTFCFIWFAHPCVFTFINYIKIYACKGTHRL